MSLHSDYRAALHHHSVPLATLRRPCVSPRPWQPPAASPRAVLKRRPPAPPLASPESSPFSATSPEPDVALARTSTSFDRLSYTVLEHVSPQLSLDLFDRLDSLPRTAARYRLRYTYNAALESFVTKCMPTPVHDAFQEYLFTSIVDLRDRFNLTRAEGKRLRLTSGTDVRSFKGAYEGSRKCADVMLMSRRDMPDDDDEREFPTVVVEVGFSEPYEMLKRDVALWLEGSEGLVKAAILVSFTETPKVDLTPFWRQRELQGDNGPQPIVEPQPANNTPHPPFGPVIHNNNPIVGTLTCFLEIWRYNPKTKKSQLSTHKTVIPPPENPNNDSFTLTLAELYGDTNVPDSLSPNDAVTFDLKEYREEIKRAVKTLANHRLEDVHQRKRKREKRKDAVDDNNDDDDEEWSEVGVKRVCERG